LGEARTRRSHGSSADRGEKATGGAGALDAQIRETTALRIRPHGSDRGYDRNRTRRGRNGV